MFIAIDPTDGRHLRPATEAEVAAYKAQAIVQPGLPGIPAWSTWGKPVRVGDVLVDTCEVAHA